MANFQLVAKRANGEINTVNLIDYIGVDCAAYKSTSSAETRKSNRIIIVGCNENTVVARKLLLARIFNKAANMAGFKLKFLRGYEKSRSKTTFCCDKTSCFGRCPFTFSVNWDSEKSCWYIWADGTGVAVHLHFPQPTMPQDVVFPYSRPVPSWPQNYVPHGRTVEHTVSSMWDDFGRAPSGPPQFPLLWPLPHWHQNHFANGRSLPHQQTRNLMPDDIGQAPSGPKPPPVQEETTFNTTPVAQEETVFNTPPTAQEETPLDTAPVAREKTPLAIKFNNDKYWATAAALDKNPSNIAQATEWCLLLFTPKDVGAVIKSKIYLQCPKRRAKYLRSTIFGVARNNVQIVGMRALHNTLHGAIGPTGREQIQKDFGIHLLPNHSNHLGLPSDPLRPIVLNEGPVVEEMATLLPRLLSETEYLNAILANRDKTRNYFALHLTFSQREGRQWWDFNNPFTNDKMRMPGYASKMDKLPFQLLRFLGETSKMVVDGFRKEAFHHYEESQKPPFFPPSTKREMLQSYLSHKFILPKSQRIDVEGISVVVGNGETSLHYDNLNDARDGYDWVVTASVMVDMTTDGRFSQQHVDAVALSGLNPHVVCIMMVLYSRHIVGAWCLDTASPNPRVRVQIRSKMNRGVRQASGFVVNPRCAM